MRSDETFVYTDFSGGLDSEGAPYLIADNEVRDSANFHTNPFGTLSKREGFTDFSTVANLTSLHPANLTTKYMIAAGGTSLYSVSPAGVATSIKSGLTANVPWTWVQGPTSGALGPMYGLNGVDTPQTWTGTGSTANWVATTGTVPNGTMLAFQGSRIWLSGNPAAPHRVYYCGITSGAIDALNWDANNYVDIEPDDGDPITAICPCGSYLMVFKARKTFAIYDLVTGANRKVSDSVGAISFRSCVDSDAGCFFYSEDMGIMRTDGSSVSDVSRRIRPLLRNITFDLRDNACGGWWRNSYLFSYSEGGSVNDAMLEYDTVTDSWWRHTIGASQFAVVDPAGDPRLYTAGVGKVQRAFAPNTYLDSGAVYTGGSYVTLPYWTWGAPHLRKVVREVRMDGVGDWALYGAFSFTDTFQILDGEVWETSDAAVATLFGGTGTFGGSGTFAPSTTAASERRYYTPGVGRAISLKALNSDGAACNLDGITVATAMRAD